MRGRGLYQKQCLTSSSASQGNDIQRTPRITYNRQLQTLSETLLFTWEFSKKKQSNKPKKLRNLFIFWKRNLSYKGTHNTYLNKNQEAIRVTNSDRHIDDARNNKTRTSKMAPIQTTSYLEASLTRINYDNQYCWKVESILVYNPKNFVRRSGTKRIQNWEA